MSARQLVGIGPFTALLAYGLYVGCSNESPPLEPAGEFATGTLTVTGADPTELPRGSTFDLQVFGSGFDKQSSVSLTVNGGTTPKIHTNETRFVSPRQLSANITVAADAPGGPYDVVVSGRNGKQGVGTELVDAKLRLFEITPATAEPGQDVHVAGSAFGMDRYAVKVTFGNRDGVIRSVSNNSIMVQVPLNVEPGDVEVRVKVRGAAYDVAAQLDVQLGNPLFSFLSPNVFAPADTIMIAGRNFGSDSDQVSVSFNSSPATVVSVTNTSIRVVVPDDIFPLTAIQIKVGDRSSVSTKNLVGVQAPIITAVGPSPVRPTFNLHLMGAYFGSDLGKITVTFCHQVNDGYYGYYYYFSRPVRECFGASIIAIQDNLLVVRVPQIPSDDYDVIVTKSEIVNVATARIFVL